MDDTQAQAIQQLYRPKPFRLFHILTGLGGCLIGLGILSAIAANWFETPRWVRLLMVLGTYTGSVLAAWRFEESRPILSRLCLLLGSFIYGGGIFLVGQMYHHGGHWTSAMAWWIVGLLPTIALLRDQWQMLLVQVLTLVFISGAFFDSPSFPQSPGLMAFLLPPWPWLFLGATWWLGRTYWRETPSVHSLTAITAVITLGIRFFQATEDPAITLLLLGAIGLITALYRPQKALHLHGGILLFGLCGLALSVPDVWSTPFFLDADTMYRIRDGLALVSGIGTAVVGLGFLIRGHRIGTTIFAVMVLRYYFGSVYSFLSKAAFFTTGGIILVLMGWFLERLRRRALEKDREEGLS